MYSTAADLDAGVAHDALDVGDDFGGRLVGFDANAGLRRVDGAGAAVQIDAIGGTADVGGAKIEGLAGDVDFDRVEVAAV